MCVSLWRAPPDKNDNIMERLSSNTALELIATLQDGRSNASLLEVKLLPATSFSNPALPPGESINVCGEIRALGVEGQPWRPNHVRLPRLPSPQHVALAKTSISVISRTKEPFAASVFVVGSPAAAIIPAAFTAKALRHALANPLG